MSRNSGPVAAGPEQPTGVSSPVGATGRARPSELSVRRVARAADDLGHPDPLDSEAGVGMPSSGFAASGYRSASRVSRCM